MRASNSATGREIVRGASFDNNLICTDEKEVFVVASVADGLLDAMCVADVEVKDFGVLLGELMNLGAEENRLAVYRQMSAFRIEAEDPVHVNLDGEPILERSFDFNVLPRRLSFVLPPGAPLSPETV